MKILVIGCNGFIGKALLSYFLKEGNEVWGCDVGVAHGRSNYFQVDAIDSDFDKPFQEIAFDVCINASGAASVPLSMENPYRDYFLNTANNAKLLNAIRKYNQKCRFVHLSSAAVYGNPTEIPIKEDSTLVPVSPYGYHKRMAEDLCEEYAKIFNVSTCSLRIFSAYGDGLAKQLFWDLNKKVQAGGVVELWGTGRESRDFIYIEDLVRVVDIVIAKAAFEGERYNVANGEEVFIEDVAKLFFDQMDSKVEYKFGGQGRPGDPINWVANIDSIKAMGYEKKFSLEKGLKNYVQWLGEKS